MGYEGCGTKRGRKVGMWNMLRNVEKLALLNLEGEGELERRNLRDAEEIELREVIYREMHSSSCFRVTSFRVLCREWGQILDIGF